MRDALIVFRIDIPALADLVAYLTGRDDQQRQIDAMAAQVEQLTAALQQSSSELKDSIEANQTQEKP